MDSSEVAILIHDFPAVYPHSDDIDTPPGTFSVTLTGRVSIIKKGSEKEELLRSFHSSQNPTMSQFIIGEEIAILEVTIMSAQLCNNQDQVTTWNSDMAK